MPLCAPWPRPAAALALALCLMLPASRAAAADDDDERSATTAASLTDAQLKAVGVVVLHPATARAPARQAAVGSVLDSAQLLSEWSELRAAQVTAAASDAESARLDGLRTAAGAASQRALETARADAARAHAQLDALVTRLALQWRPLRELRDAERTALFARLRASRAQLLRADVPGRYRLGAQPRGALVELNGAQISARVLGSVAPAGVQGASLLLEVPLSGDALSAGARLPVTLLFEPQSGWLVPSEALVYDERGAFLYKQLPRTAGADEVRFMLSMVRPLAQIEQDWLVQGLDGDDQVVVRGAGVLWSLQGVAASEQDED